MSDAIGELEFFSLKGAPEALRQQLLLVSRGGVPGHGAWRTGLRGVKFNLRSFVDMPNVATATFTLMQYFGAIGQNPVSLRWANLEMDAFSFNVLITNVTQGKITPTIHSVGGFWPGGGANLEATWELLSLGIF